MSLWTTIKEWCTANAKRLQVLERPDPDVDPNVREVREHEHYFRLWLSEMFLAKATERFHDTYPAVHAQVDLKFGSTEHQPFTRVCSPPKDHLGRGIYQNYALTELLPFQGGIVETEVSLLALKGTNTLATTLSVLEKFSQLVAPPMGQMLGVAREISAGVSSIFDAADGGVRLGYHNSFSAKGGGGKNFLKPGYILIIGATELQLPPAELSVQNGQVYRGGSLLDGFDFLLLRIEGREKRDDLPRTIDEPFRDALAAAWEDPEKGRGLLNTAIAAAFRSPDLTRVDCRRVTSLLKEEYKAVAEGGRNLARPAADRLHAAYHSLSKNTDRWVGLPPLELREAFDLNRVE